MHIMHNPSTIDTRGRVDYRELVNMGDIVNRELGHEAFAIGFVASEGRRGAWMGPPAPVPAVSKESLEGLFASTKHDNAFLNFRALAANGEWLRERRESGPLGYGAFTADWTQVVDAMIYTRRMRPSTR
jgi:erythromycin esterase-like protein